MLPDIPLLTGLMSVISLLSVEALRRWLANKEDAKLVLTVSVTEESTSDSKPSTQEPPSDL
jgi:hypothetical protein